MWPSDLAMPERFGCLEMPTMVQGELFYLSLKGLEFNITISSQINECKSLLVMISLMS